MLLFAAALIIQTGIAQTSIADPHIVGDFSQGRLTGWQEKSFSGHTEYRLIEHDGRRVLRAVSHAAAVPSSPAISIGGK